jgi:hypothetical protein
MRRYETAMGVESGRNVDGGGGRSPRAGAATGGRGSATDATTAAAAARRNYVVGAASEDVERRSCLASLAVLTASGLGGCLGDVDVLAAEPTTRLAWLAVSNEDPEREHRFDLRVERDGDVVHESSHVVERKPEDRIPGSVADCTWDDVAGRYVVSARLDGGEWVGRELTEGFDPVPDCVIADVVAGRPISPAVGVQAWCDQVDGYIGGCPAYNSPASAASDDQADWSSPHVRPVRR